MRVVSFNANGLRSAARKGFFDWFARQKADVLCVQELKAKTEQIEGSPFERRGYIVISMKRSVRATVA